MQLFIHIYYLCCTPCNTHYEVYGGGGGRIAMEMSWPLTTALSSAGEIPGVCFIWAKRAVK